MRRNYFDHPASTDDLRNRSLKGGAVSMAAQATIMFVQVLSTIVLARLLHPEDFGLIAIVAAVTGFATVFVDLGTRDALAQREFVTEGEVSALFWITFGIGLALTLAMGAAAPLISRFFDEPRLESIALAMSVTFLLPALYFQPYALMRRALMFRTLAVVDVTSHILATGVAISLAWLGYDYWALAWKQVLTPLFTTIGVWATCGWWPGRPRFTSGVKELLKFGLNIAGFGMIDYVGRSADRVALGYTSEPVVVGYYQNAYLAYDNPLTLFTTPLHGVAVATISKLRLDLDALKAAWSSALSSLTFFAAPTFGILAATGQDLVVVLLGSKWTEAGAILGVLALRGPAHVVERTSGWLHVAAGRADRWRHWGLMNCLALIAALLAGLPYGAIGVAAAYVVITYLLFIPALTYAGKPLGIEARDVVRTVGPQILTAVGVAVLGTALCHTAFIDMPPIARLPLVGVLCGAAYLGVMVFVFRITKPLTLAASLIRGLGKGSA